MGHALGESLQHPIDCRDFQCGLVFDQEFDPPFDVRKIRFGRGDVVDGGGKAGMSQCQYWTFLRGHAFSYPEARQQAELGKVTSGLCRKGFFNERGAQTLVAPACACLA